MADSTQRTSKTVEYKIVGDNTSLINSVESAIRKIDALDIKLKRIASKKDMSIVKEGQTRDAITRINSITKATNDLIKIRDILNTTNVDYLDKAQIALIKTAKQEITNLANSLGKAREAGTVTQEQLSGVSKAVHTLQQAFKNAGIQVVDYDAIAKAQAKEEKQRLKEIAAEAKEKAKVEKQTAKEAADAEKDRIRVAREAAQEYKQIVRNTVNTVTTIINILRNASRAIYELMDYSADYYETMNKFNVIAGESTRVLDDYVKEMNATLGLDYKDLYDAISSFKSIANNIKLSNEQAEMFSTTMTSLAIDLASLHNKSVEQALNALHSGLNGLQKPLHAFDIYLYEANLEQTALQHNISKSVGAMNQSEKILLRYLAILDQSTSAQGDMSRTITSTANQLKIARAQFAQLKRSLGQVATVIAMTVVPVLNVLMSALTKLFTFVAQSFGYKIENLANIFDKEAGATEGATDALSEYAKTAKGLSNLDEINLISTNTDKSSVLDPDTGGLKIDDSILKALHSYDNGLSNISKTLGDLSDKVANTLQNTLLSSVFTLFVTGLKAIGDGFTYVVNNWETFEPLIETLINLLTIFAGIALAKTIYGWGTALTSFSKKMLSVTKTLPTMTKNLRGEFMMTTETINGTTLAFSALTLAFSTVVASALFDRFEGETKKLVATISLLVAAVTAAAVAWLAYHGTMTWGAAVPVITAAVGVGAAALKATIPQMATGGVVGAPTVAMIGEGRYNEAVVPLGNSPQFSEMKEDIAAAVARKISPTPTYSFGQPSGGQTPVVLRIDGRDLARALLPYIGYVQPQTGVKLV